MATCSHCGYWDPEGERPEVPTHVCVHICTCVLGILVSARRWPERSRVPGGSGWEAAACPRAAGHRAAGPRQSSPAPAAGPLDPAQRPLGGWDAAGHLVSPCGSSPVGAPRLQSVIFPPPDAAGDREGLGQAATQACDHGAAGTGGWCMSAPWGLCDPCVPAPPIPLGVTSARAISWWSRFSREGGLRAYVRLSEPGHVLASWAQDRVCGRDGFRPKAVGKLPLSHLLLVFAERPV